MNSHIKDELLIPKPLSVSVVMATYNMAKYIEQSVMAVINQSYSIGQLIIVDDGSSDNTGDILGRISDGRISYIRLHRNMGVLSATLAGLKEVKCDLVSFVDADDLWSPDKIKKVVAAFGRDPSIMMVTHDYECIDDGGNIIPYHSDPTHNRLRDRMLLAEEDDLKLSNLFKRAVLTYDGVWLGSAYTFRASSLLLCQFSEFVDSVQLLSYKSLSHQDQPLVAFHILHPSNRDKRIFYIDEILFSYRIHSENTSGDIGSAAGIVRSAERAFATIFGTHSICQRMGADNLVLLTQEAKLREAGFLVDLYKGSKFGALLGFFGCLRFWSLTRVFKEITRFLLIVIMGFGVFSYVIRLKRKFYRVKFW